MIAVTACNTEETRQAAVAVGMDDFILKPVSVPDIILKVDAICMKAKLEILDIC